jgi:hypothetical protein
MSEEAGFGLELAERFFGLIILIVGALSTYYTLTSSEILAPFTGLFTFLSIVLLVLGVVLLTAKTE